MALTKIWEQIFSAKSMKLFLPKRNTSSRRSFEAKGIGTSRGTTSSYRIVAALRIGVPIQREPTGVRNSTCRFQIVRLDDNLSCSRDASRND